MSIYTRDGDRGETDLSDGSRVAKDAARLEVCGTLDELNSWLGLVRCEPLPDEYASLLEQIQHQLFDVGAELAAGQAAIGREDVEALEQAIDRFDAKLAPLQAFILPAGVHAAAAFHLARTVCRRAERRLVALGRSEPVSPELLSYVNRLGDLLFVLARGVNAWSGVTDASC
jgi:cob(I)alamin adenosyltransferase